MPFTLVVPWQVSRAASKYLDAAGSLQHLINLALDEDEEVPGEWQAGCEPRKR